MLEPDDSEYSVLKDGDHVGVYFHNDGWVMGVVVEVSKSARVKKKFTIEYTDEEISIWELSAAEWNEGYWRKITNST